MSEPRPCEHEYIPIAWEDMPLREGYVRKVTVMYCSKCDARKDIKWERPVEEVAKELGI